MKSVSVHGLMAFLGLLAALYTWNRPQEETETPRGEATIIECEPAQFASLTMRAGRRTVEVTPQRREGGTSYWIADTTVIERRRPLEKREAQGQKMAEADGKGKAGAETGKGAEADGKNKAEAETGKGAEADGKGKAGAEAKQGAAADGKGGTAADGAGQAAADGKGNVPAEAEPEVTEETRTSRFLARADFQKYLDWILPFRAIRRLGTFKPKQLKEFELDEVDTTLELVCGGETHTVEVGGRTYGKGDRYAKRAGDGAVYLVPATLIRDLRTAKSRFMQRDLHEFGLDEVDEARIEAQGTTRKLLHRNRQDTQTAMWVDAAAPDKRNRLFDNWFNEVSRLTASSYLDDGAEPGSDVEGQTGELEQLLSIEYLRDGESLGKMEMVRVTAEDEHYYVRTPTTQNWVTMPASVGSRVARDVAMVVGVEEPESEEETTSAPGDGEKSGSG